MTTTHYNFTEIANTDALDVVGDLDKDLGEIDSAVYSVEKKADEAKATADAAKTTADAAKTTADAAKTTADAAKTTAEEAQEASVAGLGSSFDESTRKLTIAGLNVNGNEKTRTSVTIPGGGGSADLNSVAPLLVEAAATSAEGDAVAIGNGASAGTAGSVAIGNSAKTTIKDQTVTITEGSIAIGADAEAPNERCVVIGKNAAIVSAGKLPRYVNSVVIGNTAQADVNACAIGEGAQTCSESIAIGPASIATDAYTCSFGYPHDGGNTTRRLVFVGEPKNDSDAATKAYVDAAVAALVTKYNLGE